MRPYGLRFLILLPFLVLAVAVPAAGEEDALAIIRKVEAKQTTKTSKVQLSMLIYPEADNNRNYRTMRILSYAKGEEASYMEFLEPKSIKGLRILSVGDDQWIYFPSTGRVRKIAGKSKDESIEGVGGDFTYEDLGGGKMEEKYNFEVTGGDSAKWTLTGIPKKESIYTKIVIAIDKAKYLPLKIEYYKEGKGYCKELAMTDIKVLGGRETATRMTMIDRDKNSKTVIIILQAQYNIEIDEKYFNSNRFYK